MNRRLLGRASRPRLGWLAALVLCGAGCLFHDAPPPRYFAPPSALATADDPPDGAVAVRPVRLRRVRAASYLGQQIAWRVSDVEHGLYEQRRWTEFPTRYVERVMAQALDHTAGVRRVVSGRVATLDLELVSFDEVLAPTHEAAVQILAALRAADQTAIFERAFSARRPIADDDPAAAARALGAALDDVVEQIASQVAADAPIATPAATHPRS